MHSRKSDSERGVSRRDLLAGAGVTLATGGVAAGAGYVARGRVEGLNQYAALSMREFATNAAAIRTAQSKQTVETVSLLRKKYQDPVFGKVRVWDMIEKLGLCIDASDNSLMLTSQYQHVQQILEGMERDGVTDRDQFLIALLHDLGKVMLLAGEAPEHVVGYISPIGTPSHGIGLENIVFQFGHDEFMYSRLKDYVPEHVAWTIRYHSALVNDIKPYCNEREAKYVDEHLARFQPYDLGMKSYSHLPRVEMAKYRALIEDLFPQPILF